MESLNNKTVLISGGSIAGLTTAWWMNKLGYKVTVVELASQFRTAGAAVDVRGIAIDVVKRMGVFEQLKTHNLGVDVAEFKNADDVTEGTMVMNDNADEPAGEEIEIERDKFVSIVHATIKNDVEFIFNNSIAALSETKGEVSVTFKDGTQRAFGLVIGCDGMHSGVRKTWFGPEEEYAHFLHAYSSITIVNKLLIKQRTMQMYNEPNKAVMINAYNNKTDIIFCFFSEEEIPYNYRDTAEQCGIIAQQFAGVGWRTAELLEEVQRSEGFYFDKFCQIKMPSWTKGRVALVGDAAYCASPAAGMGASLAIDGAAALADALQKHDGNVEWAFRDYNNNLRPFIEEVQATAEANITEMFILKTEEAIRKRNTQAKTV